jgi:hypothetical protein
MQLRKMETRLRPYYCDVAASIAASSPQYGCQRDWPEASRGGTVERNPRPTPGVSSYLHAVDANVIRAASLQASPR